MQTIYDGCADRLPVSKRAEMIKLLQKRIEGIRSQGVVDRFVLVILGEDLGKRWIQETDLNQNIEVESRYHSLFEDINTQIKEMKDPNTKYQKGLILLKKLLNAPTESIPFVDHPFFYLKKEVRVLILKRVLAQPYEEYKELYVKCGLDPSKPGKSSLSCLNLPATFCHERYLTSV